MRELWPSFGALLLSVIGVGLMLLYARRNGLFDIPNHRSSHSVPTPRGGGIALVGAVVAMVTLELVRIGVRSWSVPLVLAGAIIALTLIGWMDDNGPMRVPTRLTVHLLCGIALAILVNEIAPLPGVMNIAWLAWWVFWTVASINVVNFMDGIDGLIGSQGTIYGLFLFALLPRAALGSHFGLILAAACLGFLIWNWAPAKMFMGDVGSGPLGFFFVIGGALALEGAPAALVFIPIFPLFLDALLTLLIRFQRGEDLTDPHRAHLYQRLANGGYGHALVSSIYAVAAAIGALVALSVKDLSAPQMTGAISVYTVLVLLGWKVLHGMARKSQFANNDTTAGLA